MGLRAVSASGAQPVPLSGAVSRAREGDLSELGQLYAQHHAQVRAFARRLLGDDSAAEDLTHDVFVALPAALARFRGDSSILTLLFSIAVNQVRNHIRSAIRRRRAFERLEAPMARAESDPEAEVSRQQLASALTRALDTLPLEQRVVFVLCEVEERSSGEVARITDVSDATVRTRLFHARRKLREYFDREHRGQGSAQ